MPTLAELNSKVDELQTALDEEQTQIQNAINTLTEANAALTQQVADGGTAEERQAVIDKIAGVITDLKATVPDA